ncbi:MAG: helix-turn-helix domain-containing protein [Paludibacteraceae bacterium]|nr:helix-turn-helix domain-containing protein [Paludibacteraceae bacterium]
MKSYSVKEIADMLKTNPETVRRWIRKGKLEAIQDSRKEGNLVSEQMLKRFLRVSPKYAAILASPAFLGPVFGIGTVATIVSEIMMNKQQKNANGSKTRINISEIKKKLKIEIDDKKQSIRRKEERIRELQSEIEAEKAELEEVQQLLRSMSTKTDDAEK